MRLKSPRHDKVEMDDTAFWELDKSEWPTRCLAYLAERVAANSGRRPMVVTCGGLPLPDHPAYPRFAQEHDVAFVHTLVLVRSIDDYKLNIAERGLTKKTEELLKHYAWRESTKALHDEVVYNAPNREHPCSNVLL